VGIWLSALNGLFVRASACVQNGRILLFVKCFYKQTFGTAMGSLVSSFEANLVIEYLENRTLEWIWEPTHSVESPCRRYLLVLLTEQFKTSFSLFWMLFSRVYWDYCGIRKWFFHRVFECKSNTRSYGKVHCYVIRKPTLRAVT